MSNSVRVFHILISPAFSRSYLEKTPWLGLAYHRTLALVRLVAYIEDAARGATFMARQTGSGDTEEIGMKDLLAGGFVVVLATVSACATARATSIDGPGLDAEPRLIECPSQGRDRNGWDRVTFRFIVLADGSVDATSIRHVFDPDDRLTSPDAVERGERELLQCSFEPGRSNGRAVSALLTITVRVEPRT